MAKKTLVNGVWVSPGQTTYVAGNGKTYNVGTNPNSSVSSSSSTTKSTTPTKSVVADTSEYDKVNRINADSEHDYTDVLESLSSNKAVTSTTTPTEKKTTTSSTGVTTYAPNVVKDETTDAYNKLNRVTADSEKDYTEALELANTINTPKTEPKVEDKTTITPKIEKILLSGGTALQELYDSGWGDPTLWRKNSEGDIIGYGEYGESTKVNKPTTSGGGSGTQPTTSGGLGGANLTTKVTETELPISDANGNDTKTITLDDMAKFKEDYGVEYNPNLSYLGNLYIAQITQSQNSALAGTKKSAKLAYENELAKISEEEDKAKQQAEEANRLAYIRNMLANKNLNQALAVQGISGGATESALLQLASNYGNQVATNNQNLANALSGYSTDRLNAYNQKEQAIADAKAQREQNIANALSTLQTQQYTTETNADKKKTESTTFDVDKALKTRSTLIEQGIDTTQIDNQLEENGYKVNKPTSAETIVPEEEKKEEPIEYTEEEYKQNFKDARSTILQMIKEDKSYDDLMGYLEEAKPYLTEKNYKYLVNYVETRKNADTYFN